ncbi:MAG: RNA methyltransferase [Flavobacteriales bacterium TMED123]|nr:MAG: RNA methyltransferase [Flavobacteriales bacterium TMED123]|tara:strand:- start:241 stop:783 length:543 start_codon:yes stop_codon:yes gene_type:complete
MRKLKNSELQRITSSEFKKAEKNPIILVLDNVRSAMNVGSIFRSADAFLIEKIYLCGITASPPNKEILKTALGAQKHIEWQYNENTISLIKTLKHPDNYLVAVEQTKKSIILSDFTPPKNKIILIFGNEVFGVNQKVIDLCDTSIEIPQYGTKHSLNISVSAGIVMWDILQNIKKDNISQ